MSVQATRSVARRPLLDRLGIPRAMAWGYPGLLLFMIGDGVESGYLSSYLHGHGVGSGDVALLFTVYGIAVAIGAFCSGSMCEVWGPKRVMFIGLAIWGVFETLFLAGGITPHSYPVMLIAYGLRGFGYPLFAYGFLIWIATTTQRERLGTASGWFWFAFTGGLPTLGALFASVLIPAFGQLATFWSSLVLVMIGGAVALVGLREASGLRPLGTGRERPLQALLGCLTIARSEPKLASGAIVRAINTIPQAGFLVFMPVYFTHTLHYSLSQWLRLLSCMFITNIVFNLIFGIVGDIVGWRRTVALFGSLGSAITLAAFYFVPSHVHSYGLAILTGCLYGATLAGFVPLSAIMPSLAPDDKTKAMSMLNLGAGASVFLGPAIAGIFIAPLGVEGVMLIFAGLYVVGAGLAWTLKIPDERSQIAAAGPARYRLGTLAAAGAGTLLGHSPSLAADADEDDIDLILFDVGGCLYDDDAYARALLAAVQELAEAPVSDAQFWDVYDTQRGSSSGSLRTVMASAFVPGADRALLSKVARSHWEYPPESLYPDTLPSLSVLAQHYKLGLVANSPDVVIEAMARDDLAGLFTVVALADNVGVEKPKPGIFTWALSHADCDAAHTVMVGNRLDTDIRPAQQLGMRTVWLLRGEAPPAPTGEQLDEPDAVITSLTGLPAALARIAHEPEPEQVKVSRNGAAGIRRRNGADPTRPAIV